MHTSETSVTHHCFVRTRNAVGPSAVGSKNIKDGASVTDRKAVRAGKREELVGL
jgi:hypothetical protein